MNFHEKLNEWVESQKDSPEPAVLTKPEVKRLFEECGIDPAFYANRKREFTEILPWDHIDYGIKKEFLIDECKKAYESKTTPNCREDCSKCGANRFGGGVCFENR